MVKYIFKRENKGSLDKNWKKNKINLYVREKNNPWKLNWRIWYLSSSVINLIDWRKMWLGLDLWDGQQRIEVIFEEKRALKIIADGKNKMD